MARLVEILAKEMDVWPDGAKNMTQDNDGGVSPCTDPNNDLSFNGSSWTSSDGFNMGISILGALDLADDHAISVVTRDQWQAERDRQKGGEWKRHRGGNQPVADDVRVEVKLRDGDAQEAKASAFLWNHSDCDVYANIMQYRVISQPQAEEVEVNKFCMGEKCSATAENIAHSQQCQLEHEMAYTGFKIDQIDGPIKWRDTVNELDAYIEEFTRERELLINRLALEGFALIPAMTAVMGVADVDMSDWRNWQVGDIVSIKDDVDVDDGEYSVLEIEHSEYEGDMPIKTDGGWPDMDCAKIEFVRRP